MTPELTVPVHSNYFINGAWKKFSNEVFATKLNEYFGFDIALYWLVESAGNSFFQPKFILASTCLETLMDRFHTRRNSEFLLEESKFRRLKEILRRRASEWLKSQEIDATIRKSIYENLATIQRRSFKDKANLLIENLKLNITDLDNTFDEIVKIRNTITHTGITSLSFMDHQWNVYKRFMSILIRVFLAILEYDGEFYDPWESRWIDFRRDCILP